MDTPFDADSFMTTTIDEPLATALQVVPDGEYVAMVGEFDSTALKSVNTKNGPRQILEVPFIIQDDALRVKMGREQVVHRESFWLDFTADGRLDTSADKNVRLGQLRAALDQNKAGQPWSPAMLRNMGPLRIAIKTTSDKNDSEKKYTNITKYARIS